MAIVEIVFKPEDIATAFDNAAQALIDAAAADEKAVTADGKAVTADGKAVTADGKAVVADGKAVAAQEDATLALASVATVEAEAVKSNPDVGEYKVTGVKRNAAGGVVILYNDTPKV